MVSAIQTKKILVVPLMGDVINQTNKYGGSQSSITEWGKMRKVSDDGRRLKMEQLPGHL